jgi:hypothetical protein
MEQISEVMSQKFEHRMLYQLFTRWADLTKKHKKLSHLWKSYADFRQTKVLKAFFSHLRTVMKQKNVQVLKRQKKHSWKLKGRIFVQLRLMVCQR